MFSSRSQQKPAPLLLTEKHESPRRKLRVGANQQWKGNEETVLAYVHEGAVAGRLSVEKAGSEEGGIAVESLWDRGLRRHAYSDYSRSTETCTTVHSDQKV